MDVGSLACSRCCSSSRCRRRRASWLSESLQSAPAAAAPGLPLPPLLLLTAALLLRQRRSPRRFGFGFRCSDLSTLLRLCCASSRLSRRSRSRSRGSRRGAPRSEAEATPCLPSQASQTSQAAELCRRPTLIRSFSSTLPSQGTSTQRRRGEERSPLSVPDCGPSSWRLEAWRSRGPGYRHCRPRPGPRRPSGLNTAFRSTHRFQKSGAGRTTSR